MQIGEVVTSAIEILISVIVAIKDFILGILPLANQDLILIGLSFAVVWVVTELENTMLGRSILTILLFIMLKTVGG